MKFNEAFDDYMGLYTEGGLWDNINKKKKEGKESSHGNSDAHKAAVKAGNKLEKGKSSDEESSEDNETAKKVGKGALKVAGRAVTGTAKLAGKAAVGVADFVTHGDFSDTVNTIKKAYLPGDNENEDCESCGCSGEDCETCGCEENPEYGHLDDTYSSYIDQYAPKEDGERVDKDRMKCNSPKRGGSKKFVVKACENGKEKIVRFGDPNMKIRKSNPKARKSFRARHKCDQKKSKFSAGYWSCKKW